MFKLLEKIPLSILVVINLIIVLLLGLIDYITGIEFSFSIFYFLPIIIASWYIGTKTGIFFSFVCVTTWFSADFFGEHIYSSGYFLAWNTMMRLFIFLIISITICNLKKNSEMVMKNKLLIQKSLTIINTSQRMTGIIVEHISKYNSELLFWVGKQKANGKIISKIIESTCCNIGSSLSVLTEICFGQIISNKKIDIEEFINSLQERLSKIKDDYDKFGEIDIKK